MSDVEHEWKEAQDAISGLKKELAKVIVGQEEVIELMLTALLCRGHCLLVGVPGLAKTLLVSTLGKVLGLSFRRIQFTPDLMPMDILGSEILQDSGGARQFEFQPGPIFAHLILADEINRTPPKTQAALLEAMQEKQVTVAGNTRPLPEPFLVFATQNPIEHEGTYPLPEAQLDRFFFELHIDYPTSDEERKIVLQTTGEEQAEAEAILDPEKVMNLQKACRSMPLPDHVLDAILKLVASTRPSDEHADDYIKRYVAFGAGPRASQTLATAAKALAFLRGKTAASLDDVRAVARPVFRHRVLPNYNATGEGISVETIIEHLLKRMDG